MRDFLITANELEPLLKYASSDYLVLDARVQRDYKRGHIPGACHISWDDWNESPPDDVKSILRQPGYWGKLQDYEQGNFKERLENLGVGNDRQIIVYGDGRKTKGYEGRIAWMLAYLGHPDVKILDGGIHGWTEEGYPLEQKDSPTQKASFEINLQEERRILHKDLVNKLESSSFPTLLDTRSMDEFTGKVFWYQPNKGRIPKAHLVVYNDIFSSDGKTFIDKETYKSMIPLGYEKQQSVGTYCEVGVRTCTVALLHEHYTGQILPVYDGSIMEWTFDKELPILKA